MQGVARGQRPFAQENVEFIDLKMHNLKPFLSKFAYNYPHN